MENVQELLTEIQNLVTEFVADATANVEGNKAAGRRARKTTLELTRLFKDYRVMTIESERKTETRASRKTE